MALVMCKRFKECAECHFDLVLIHLLFFPKKKDTFVEDMGDRAVKIFKAAISLSSDEIIIIMTHRY